MGEPLLLAIGAVTALRHAIQAFGADENQAVALKLPATSEHVLDAIERQRGKA